MSRTKQAGTFFLGMAAGALIIWVAAIVLTRVMTRPSRHLCDWALVDGGQWVWENEVLCNHPQKQTDFAVGYVDKGSRTIFVDATDLAAASRLLGEFGNVGDVGNVWSAENGGMFPDKVTMILVVSHFWDFDEVLAYLRAREAWGAE